LQLETLVFGKLTLWKNACTQKDTPISLHVQPHSQFKLS